MENRTFGAVWNAYTAVEITGEGGESEVPFAVAFRPRPSTDRSQTSYALDQ
jgi:hypothetical protein